MHSLTAYVYDSATDRRPRTIAVSGTTDAEIRRAIRTALGIDYAYQIRVRHDRARCGCTTLLAALPAAAA